MPGSDLLTAIAAWRARMGLTQRQAAAALRDGVIVDDAPPLASVTQYV